MICAPDTWYGASDGPMLIGADVPLDVLLAELVWFELPLVLLLLLCVPLCDAGGPLSDEVPAAHAPTMKQSEKIPVERK
jgi:hypothetical protein